MGNRIEAGLTNVRGTEDCAVPVAHHHILTISKTVGACLYNCSNEMSVFSCPACR